MRYALPFILASLAACNSPSPAMMGQAETRVVVDGAEFAVRQRDPRAEAIRLNFIANPSIGMVLSRAEQAMEQATGCDVLTDTLRGELNVMRAELSCPEG